MFLCSNRKYQQLVELIERNHKQTMSAISDFSAKVEANFATIKTGIQNLDTQIQNFNPTGISPADQALLDQITADSAALATAANAPVVPATPTA